jgi:hypothetical protein
MNGRRNGSNDGSPEDAHYADLLAELDERAGLQEG